MPLHIQVGSCQHFGNGISLVKGTCILNFSDQLIRDRSIGLVMPGVVFQHGRIDGPMFVELRWEFHKIPCRSRSGKTWILLIGKEPMQSMAKLMEHRGYIIKADQGGLAIGRFGKITYVEY